MIDGKLRHDPVLVSLIKTTDKKTLSLWAIDCVEKFMPIIEDKYPNELRPKEALNALKRWMNDELKMWDARKFTYPTLDAARAFEKIDKPACQIARACSHALATCHVATHSEGSAMYVLSAIYHLHKDDKDVSILIKNERDWQIKHLKDLIKK